MNLGIAKLMTQPLFSHPWLHLLSQALNEEKYREQNEAVITCADFPWKPQLQGEDIYLYSFSNLLMKKKERKKKLGIPSVKVTKKL